MYLVLLMIVLNLARLLWLTDHNRWNGISLLGLGLLYEWDIGCKIACLALPGSGWRPRGWWRSRGIALWLVSWVIVNSFHVVSEIPVPWKAISGNSSLTPLIGAKEGLIAMSMHCMSFALMAEQASRMRETKLLTGINLALIWL